MGVTSLLCNTYLQNNKKACASAADVDAERKRLTQASRMPIINYKREANLAQIGPFLSLRVLVCQAIQKRLYPTITVTLRGKGAGANHLTEAIL
jgi:hypothetical protein